VTTSDDSRISEDRREALRLCACDRQRRGAGLRHRKPGRGPGHGGQHARSHPRHKVLRIAVLPGELPYFNKDLASGTWSGFSIEMANDIAKLLDVQLEFTESTYGNSILDLQSNKIDLGFALNPTPQRALVVDFCATVFSASIRRHA